MKPLLTLLFGVLFSSFSNAQNFNRPVPSVLLPYEYNQLDTNINFYTGINMNYRGDMHNGTYDLKRGVLLDPDGFIAWYQLTPTNNANSFGYNEANQVFQEVISLNQQNKLYVTIDTTFQIIDTVQPVNAGPDAHEFWIEPNGHKFLSTFTEMTMDLSAYTINGSVGSATTNVLCNGVQEFDNNGTLVFEWSSCDDVHPSEADGFGYNANRFDYFHINSIDVDEDDGHLLVSARHLNAIIKVDHNTGDVIWRLGGSNSDFTFVGDSGFSGQHDCRSEGNGVYTLFDNANLAVDGKSRAVRYELDTVNWTATLLDEFNHNPLVSGTAQGSYRVIDGYGVVNYGFALRPEPNITIFDEASQALAAEYYFTDSVITYRAVPSHLDFVLPRPVIECFDSLGTMYLKAPNGFASYEWSNGSMSQEIVPVIGETYQVYVPYGIGKLGSIPFGYNGTCTSNVSVPELTSADKILVKTIDLMGREVDMATPGQVYLEIYSDGSVQRIFSMPK
ncbi:MAG: arylsulfotransferase family protein [Crocinitomicaceae bacterium]